MLGQLQARLSRAADRPVFSDPMQLIAADAQALDAASERLSRALPNLIQRNGQALDAECSRMLAAGPNVLVRFDNQMRTGASRLHDLSPVAVLGRGYSITRTPDGDVVRSVDQAPAGSTVMVSVANGRLACEVQDAVKADAIGV